MNERTGWEEAREYGHKVLAWLMGAIVAGLVMPYVAMWILY